MPEGDQAKGVVLILAPRGSDAERIAKALTGGGIANHVCRDLNEVSERFGDLTNAIIIAEEALVPAKASALLNRLSRQPAWSEVPVLILTARSGGARKNPAALEFFSPTANLTLLQRPLNSVMLVAATKVASHARRRQRGVRDLLQQRETDISERKRQDERLRESQTRVHELEQRSRLAVEAADVGTFDYFPATGELVWSKRCNELFGLPEDWDAGYDDYINGIHPDDRHVIHETVAGVAQPGNSGRYDIEYRCVGKSNGEVRWLSEKGRALHDESGKVTRFMGAMLDITARKTGELALERAKREAEEANHAKDQFLAMLSHELRTPLTPVLMTLAVMRRDEEISETTRKDLEVLQRNVELEALLIDDLLDLTRIAHGKFELNHEGVDIHASIEHALEISKPDLSRKNLTITVDLQAREHHCWADAARLQQVFWNLLKNAIKFTPGGGKVEVRTRNEADRFIVIEVKDNGIGIDPTAQPRIFDAFEQGGRSVTSKFGGLGLGLTISKRVIDLHHGIISVESDGQNRGATFLIKLKVMETSLLQGPAYLLDFDAIAAGPAEILLVEDHHDTARVMTRILESAGYSVAHAGGVAQALEVAAERRFDLVISDVGLPDGTGLELMRELKKQHGLNGIALSGFGTEEDVVASREAGFSEHITKPVDWNRLRDAITKLVAEPNKSNETVSTRRPGGS